MLCVRMHVSCPRLAVHTLNVLPRVCRAPLHLPRSGDPLISALSYWGVFAVAFVTRCEGRGRP